jgi:hypothetical protein
MAVRLSALCTGYPLPPGRFLVLISVRGSADLRATVFGRVRSDAEKKWEYNEAVHQLFVDFKKAYDSVRREVLYSIPIEFGVPMILVRLIKTHLN